ncbi:hypothetical protein BGZ54_002121 [Gamsiella multidivaricata]|nr:hypothetical protein BGZ54_002121 [Gamsiella multidivaricata]
MPEPTVPAPPGTQLMADASPVPVQSLEDFLAHATADVMPDSPSEASDYYDWPFEQRARVLGCPSTFHLCKTLVFENTKWKQDETKVVDADRYWCVIVQYEGSVNITKLEKAVRERTGASRKGMHLRIAPAEKSHELTGFTNNAVSPVVSSVITELSPPLLYLGAGHVDWKIALPVQSFVEKWNASVIDFS